MFSRAHTRDEANLQGLRYAGGADCFSR